MSESVDIIIVGSGPGGLAAGIKASEAGKTHVILEKGNHIAQGIIDSYPRGKLVYPTIPKGETGPFPVEDLAPPQEKISVEAYLEQLNTVARNHSLNIRYGRELKGIAEEDGCYRVRTGKESWSGKTVILAFGSNIPNDLGIYGEARTVARTIENPQDYIGVTALVIGGGNAAADVVSALSKHKREAGDPLPVYWGHIHEKFEINTDTARDLGEEILLGGQIRILQGAVPKIGEVDSEGIDRLYIHQSPGQASRDDVFMYQGMSFPMKNVIACVGSHGPSAVFEALDLQQLTCTGDLCRIAREGERVLLLSTTLQTSRKGIYAIGGSISPSYMEIQAGVIKEKRHSNLIFTAVKDAVIAVDGIVKG